MGVIATAHSLPAAVENEESAVIDTVTLHKAPEPGSAVAVKKTEASHLARSRTIWRVLLEGKVKSCPSPDHNGGDNADDDGGGSNRP